MQIVKTTPLTPYLRKCLLPWQINKCDTIEYTLYQYTMESAVLHTRLKKSIVSRIHDITMSAFARNTLM